MIKAVITDIDGTLCDYVGISWVRFLGANKYIRNGLFEQHEDLVEAYRHGLIDHVNFTREWVVLYGQMVCDKKVSDLEKLARQFLGGFRKGIPEHSRQLLAHFMKNGYVVIAVTASPRIPVDLVMKDLGIKEFYCTELEIKNGKYTGAIESTMHLAEKGKENIVREIIMSHEVDTSVSFALGDTIHDLPLLESVAYPIAINPKGRLADYAAENGFWVANYENVVGIVNSIEKSGKKSMFEQMKFLYETGMLRYTPRSGWAYLHVDQSENVAEHSFRASLIAYLLAIEEDVDPYKCAVAMLFHDLGEIRIMDINKITAMYFTNRKDAEKKAFDDMLGRLDAYKKEKVMEAYYHAKDKRIGVVCKDADLLEVLMTAREYEFKGYKNAREWIIRAQSMLKTTTAKRWGRVLAKMDPDSWWFGIKKVKRDGG